MGCWLSLRAYQIVTKELDFIFFQLQKIKKYKEIIIWKFFERNFARNCVKNWFFLQNNSVENSLVCPKNKSASHCPTGLFPIYPNNHWTIRRRDDHIVVPSSHCNILKIDWFLELVTESQLGEVQMKPPTVEEVWISIRKLHKELSCRKQTQATNHLRVYDENWTYDYQQKLESPVSDLTSSKC